MRPTTDEHAGWLPHLLGELLARRRGVVLPDGGSIEAAALLVDVSGFTALTEKLAERGPAGAERLTEVLNERFGGIIAAIDQHGGDITHFAGDAIAAIFRADAGAAAATMRERATACAHAVQALPMVTDAGESPLLVRAGVAAGTVWWATLGADDERVLVVGGAPLVDAANAAASATPGETVVSRERASSAVVDAPAPPTDAPAPSPRVFLPRPIRPRLAEVDQWLAEFRRVTVLFAGFGDRDFAAPERLAHAQLITLAVESAITRYDGSLHQLITDGPGAVLIAAFGLPGQTHEDDARRGVEAAVAIERELAALGTPCTLGVTTGRVFCGVRGSPVRREWAMLGDTMNLAARLMRNAGQGVLCDAETARAARAHVTFTAQPPIKVKGKAQPVAVSRPAAAAVGGPTPRARARTVGRDDELRQIDAALDALMTEKRGAAWLLEGEAGIGKSQLLATLEERATARGAVVMRGDADAIESATAYFVWRAVLTSLFSDGAGSMPRLADRVVAALSDDAALSARAPLLNDVLPLDLAETAVTAQMEAHGRADALRDLVAALLRRAAARAPLVVILDDAHWFDSASWALIAAAAHRAPAVWFVVSTRPIAAPQPPALRQLSSAGAVSISLAPLSPEHALELVRQRLSVDAIPAAAAAFIHEKSQGNPFFAEQLALSLCDGGHLVVEGRACRLATSLADLRALGLPDTVQGVVSGRIDRLASSEQLTLKVASVIGRTFPFRILHDVYPSEPERPALPGALDHLTSLDLTREDAPEPDLAHLFTHVTTQQVAYELMSFAQRRQLHRAIATWYEARYGDDLSPHLPLLAHHWAAADEASRAVGYLERAATQALERYANEEVLRFLAEARALSARGGLVHDDARLARWEMVEGEARLKLARYTESRTHFLASLKLLGLPVPTSRGGLVWSLLVGSTRQLVRRVLGRVSPAANDAWREALLQGSHLHQRLAEVGYWGHDILTLAHSAVASLNYAEPAGVSRQLQMAHHVLGFVAGLAGSSWLFNGYRRRAAALSQAVGHIETTAFCAQLDAIYFNANARWAELHEAAARGGNGFERIGDRFRWQTCVVLRGWASMHQGDTKAARSRFDEAHQMVRAEGATQVEVWSVAGLLAVDLAEERRTTAERLASLEALLAAGVDHSDAIMCRGLLALGYHRAGERDAALAHTTAATPLIDMFPPASFHTLLGTAAVAEIRLAEWERTGDTAARKAAFHAARGLARFAGACTIGRPRSWLARGELHRVAGNPRRARQCYQRALTEAEGLGMQLDASLARAALGDGVSAPTV